MTLEDLPPAVAGLVEQREAARRRGDFGAADGIRDQIRRAGFEIADTSAGPRLAPTRLQAPRGRTAAGAESLLDRPPTHEASIHWLVQGWPDDVLRGVRSMARHAAGRLVHQVVVDVTDSPVQWPAGVEVLRLAPDPGWAAATNAGLRRSRGAVAVIADGSIEADGDVLSPLLEALVDPSVGVTGPFGAVTDDLREFRDSPGPEVDAVEAYLIAMRRELLTAGLRFDEKFRFYRSADLEFSFQVKAMGLRATVTPVPVRRHEHRMWANTPEDRRDRLSKRNFYRFLDRWRGRTDLLVNRDQEARPSPAGGC